MASFIRTPLLATLLLGAVTGFAYATPVALQNATASFSQAPPCSGSWPASAAIDGVFTTFNGWAIAQSDCLTTNAETAWFETAADQGNAGGAVFTLTLSQLLGNTHTLGDFTLSYTTDPRVGGFSDAVNWTALPLASASATNGATLTITGNEVQASGVNPDTSVYTITTQSLFATGITGFRIATLLDAAFPGNGPGRQPTNGNFVLTEFEVDVQAVPIPAPGALLLLGSSLLLTRSRRRRAHRAL